MKGIELCAECAYYNMKSHKCTRGCKIDPDSEKGEDVRFFVDCPLPDVQPVKHGRWIPKSDYWWLCSNCKNNLIYSDAESDRTEKQRYCSRCGARMDGDADA